MPWIPFSSSWKFYVPAEQTLPLLEVMSKYEHTGRVLFNEGQWANVVVEPSALLTPILLGDDSEPLLSPRLEHKDSKQVGCLNVKTLIRLLEADQPMMLECSSGQGQQVRVFCKYFPSDYNADHMMSLAALETSKQGGGVGGGRTLPTHGSVGCGRLPSKTRDKALWQLHGPLRS